MKLSRGKKVGIGVLLVLIFLILGLYILGKNSDAFSHWIAERQERALQAWVDKNLEREKQAYRDDRDGGKTAEETVTLFVNALKAGNLEQAAKYYELPLQTKALKNLQGEVAQYGNVDQTIAYFTEVTTKGKKQCNEKGDGCTFEYKYITSEDEYVKVSGTDKTFFVPKGSNDRKVVNLSTNELSHVWKISN